jgi:hypothetical protein
MKRLAAALGLSVLLVGVVVYILTTLQRDALAFDPPSGGGGNPCDGAICPACQHCYNDNGTARCVDDPHDACHDACGNPVCSGGCDCCLPVIVSQPASQTRSSGQSATFEVTTTGGAASSYQWRKNSVDLGNGGTVSGATSAILTLISVTTYDSEASYDVIVANACGSVTSSPPALLTVVPDDDPAHYENTPPSFTVSYPPAGATIP